MTTNLPELVAVLGMHRSGTSAAAGLLAQAGGWLGRSTEIMAPNDGNEAGYFERTRLVNCVDLMLRSRGLTWALPMSADLLAGRYRSDEVELLALHLHAVRVGAPDWCPLVVVKDPRLCLYSGLLPRLDMVQRYVVCLRDPIAIARSLHRVHGIEMPIGLALWEYYTVCLTSGLAGQQVSVFDFDRALEDPEISDRLLSSVGARGLRPSRPSLTRSLRHFEGSPVNHELLSEHQHDIWADLTTAVATHTGMLPSLVLSEASAALLARNH